MRVHRCLRNRLHDPLDILEDFVIPKPQYPISLSHQERTPGPIRVCLDRVLTTIEFDNKAALGTAKVSDEGTNRMLSSEFHAFQLSGTKPGPKPPFRDRLITTQTTRTTSEF